MFCFYYVSVCLVFNDLAFVVLKIQLRHKFLAVFLLSYLLQLDTFAFCTFHLIVCYFKT